MEKNMKDNDIIVGECYSNYGTKKTEMRIVFDRNCAKLVKTITYKNGRR